MLPMDVTATEVEGDQVEEADEAGGGQHVLGTLSSTEDVSVNDQVEVDRNNGEKMQRVIEEVKVNIKQSQRRQKRNYDKRRAAPNVSSMCSSTN